jgi:hypothetical protein
MRLWMSLVWWLMFLALLHFYSPPDSWIDLQIDLQIDSRIDLLIDSCQAPRMHHTALLPIRLRVPQHGGQRPALFFPPTLKRSFLKNDDMPLKRALKRALKKALKRHLSG